MKNISFFVLTVFILLFASCANENKKTDLNNQNIENKEKKDSAITSFSKEVDLDSNKAINSMETNIEDKTEILKDIANQTKLGVHEVTDNAKQKLKQSTHTIVNETETLSDKTVHKIKELSGETKHTVTKIKNDIEDNL